MKLKAQIMDEAAIGRALMRIHNRGVDNVVLVGVRRRGVPIARCIRGNIHKIEDKDVPCGSLDIKFYRDDLSHVSEQPETRRAELPFDVTDRDVVLCDDVIYTGRTARAAIEAIFSLGRRRADRPRPPRAAHPPRLRRQEHPDLAQRARGGPRAGVRRRDGRFPDGPGSGMSLSIYFH